MGKITTIEPQRRRGRFNIFIDDKFAIGVFEEVIITSRLKEGQEVNLNKIKELQKKEEEFKAYNSALQLLSYRLRSEKELRDRLVRKFPANLVEKIINRLKKEKLIDDAEFARAWVKNRMSLKPKGKKFIKSELFQKGIEKDLIQKTLEKEYNEDKEIELATEITKKKLNTLKNLPRLEARQKLIGFLQRRGFGWETIKKVIENL